MEYYGCVVDLLGRVGFLIEVDDFIKRMFFEFDDIVLGVFLGVCKFYGVVELGNEVGRRLFKLYLRYCGKYFVLWNINVVVEKWDFVVNLRKVMIEVGIRKILVFSLIEFV